MGAKPQRWRGETTYAIAHAAAWDAGNRSAAKGGRKKWSRRDWRVACETFARLMRLDQETLRPKES